MTVISILISEIESNVVYPTASRVILNLFKSNGNWILSWLLRSVNKCLFANFDTHSPINGANLNALPLPPENIAILGLPGSCNELIYFFVYA